jgi:hypothetical protein
MINRLPKTNAYIMVLLHPERAPWEVVRTDRRRRLPQALLPIGVGASLGCRGMGPFALKRPAASQNAAGFPHLKTVAG